MTCEIITCNGTRTLVDLEMVGLLTCYWWNIDKHGYVRAPNNGKTILMHRLIMQPKFGEVVDHINANKLDNRKENLRLCEYSQNSARKISHKENKLGLRGVWENQNAFEAAITIDGHRVYIGRYPTAIAAARAYDAVARWCLKEYAKLNFSSEPWTPSQSLVIHVTRQLQKDRVR